MPPRCAPSPYLRTHAGRPRAKSPKAASSQSAQRGWRLEPRLRLQLAQQFHVSLHAPALVSAAPVRGIIHRVLRIRVHLRFPQHTARRFVCFTGNMKWKFHGLYSRPEKASRVEELIDDMNAL